MISVVQCEDANEWDDMVIGDDGHPLQLWGWGELKSKHGWSADRLIVKEDDVVIGWAQVLTKQLPLPLRAFSYIPRNKLFHVKQSETLNSIADYVKSIHKSVALSVEPDSEEFEKPDKWVRATNKILPAETIIIDLTQNEDAILSAMAKKTRQYIRKSSKDIEVRQVKTSDELMACLDIYKDTAKRAGFALHSDQYYKDVYESLGDHSPIFTAYSEGKLVAFLWLAISGDVSYELYGGMNDTGQQLRANYTLKWYAIQKVKQWDLTRYDFGGLVAGGVATFKQGWVSDSVTLVGTYDKPLSPLYVIWSHTLPFAKKVVQKVRKVARR